ncbi:amino acid ABC transporter ATP-binding protein [Actinokineospora sp.]|uniref:amino acid ABC transporter ATP-binding protein n=1 Tax=Actinokineospora sp. TaxID=1872133 RepID=UPI003D6A5330
MTLPLPNSPSALEIDDVHLSYGRTRVLRGATLSVESGQTTCVIGPSGSGKSTLLRAVNRLTEPDSGDIRLAGESVLGLDPDRVRRRVGMVFQQFNLFGHRTVLDNLVLPLRSVRKLTTTQAQAIAFERLADVGLVHKADHRPAALSGGQQQRVAIARALAMEPEIILFDEPTSALDPELVQGVLDLIAELAGRGMTMVVVTHEMGFAREVADTVAFMDHGRVVETATPGRFFESPESPRLQRFLSQVR